MPRSGFRRWKSWWAWQDELDECQELRACACNGILRGRRFRTKVVPVNRRVYCVKIRQIPSSIPMHTRRGSCALPNKWAVYSPLPSWERRRGRTTTSWAETGRSWQMDQLRQPSCQIRVRGSWVPAYRHLTPPPSPNPTGARPRPAEPGPRVIAEQAASTRCRM